MALQKQEKKLILESEHQSRRTDPPLPMAPLPPVQHDSENAICGAGTLFWEWALDTLQERDGLTVLANDTTFTQIIVPALREAQTYASPSVPGCQQVAPRPTAPPVQACAPSHCRLRPSSAG